MRTAVYCGSFNPVHKGHIKIAGKCLKKGLCDRVLIIATGNYWDKQDLLPVSDRIRMLDHYASDSILIDKEHNEIPYTYELFRVLKEDYPEDELCLLIGADNLARFDQWREYRELLVYNWIVIPRDEMKTAYIRKCMKQLGKENYSIINMHTIDISSTYIREHLKHYEDIKDIIDKEVYDDLVSVLSSK